ncbi:MAG: hypothetical protein WD080_03685 [Egibacteraceae bacterium]
MTDDPRLPRVVLRGIGAVLLATQGVVHLWLWRDGYAEIPVIGPLFLAGALTAFVLAVAVLATNNRVVVSAGVLLSLGQVAAFTVSSSVGLFGFETQWTWSGPEGAALWSELLAAIALIALVLWRRNAVHDAAAGFATAR